MEQMFLALMQKQQEMEPLMVKMMSGQQTLEKKMEQQKKELEKEHEERKRDEDWLRTVEFADMLGEGGDEVEELPKKAPRVVGVKRGEDVDIPEERTV